MEIKINKEIRDYAETVFFGLSFRQFIFSICAMAIAVVVYFILKPYFGISDLSWMCVLSALPFAILGFVKYNGMNAEELIMAWIKTTFIMPYHLKFKGENIYGKMIEPEIQKIRKQKSEYMKGAR